MTTVYGDIQSGNCYKIALLFAQLEIEHVWKPVSVVNGDTKTDEFMALNPAAQIPVVVLDSGDVLTQSNAILNYFAEGTHLMPQQSLEKARVQEWQFYEQYNHEPTIAVRRFISKFLGMPADRKDQYNNLEAAGYRALQVMDDRLAEHKFLAGAAYTVADISLYAYTHVADEGGFDLSRVPSVLAWINRVRQQPGYIGMD